MNPSEKERLDTLSKSALIEMILDLKKSIAQKNQRIVNLEERITARINRDARLRQDVLPEIDNEWSV